MKRTKLVRRISSVFTLIGIFVLSLIFFYFFTGANFRNSLINPGLNLLKTTIQKPTPPSEFNGWIGWWDENIALENLSQNSKIFKSVSPLWYRINKSGTAEKIPNSSEDQIKSVVSQQNIKLIPTISNEFDPNRIALVLNNTDISSVLVEDLKTLALNSNYQGWDIDWEEINPNDQPAFTAFIQKLADVMHQSGLVLTISVHPQTGKPTDRAVAKGYDLKALAAGTDALKIMAYDFHNQNSNPGAITPFKDLTDVLTYTKSILSPEKVILGLPTYGYDWEANKKPAEAVSFQQAQDRIKTNGGQTKRDPESNSLTGSYKINGKEHIIWFEDAETINKMIALARSFGIYQFSFWRVGIEDPALWKNPIP